MSMEKHKCKLCSKRFLTGKALGGHMRSHLMALPLPPKDSSESALSLCSSEVSEQNKEGSLGNYGLRENPKKSFKIIDPEFLEYVIVQDKESESESTKNPSPRRSRRSKKMVDFEAMSLLSNSSSEEDIAMCLMMLSRDVCRSSKESKLRPKQGKYQCGICCKMFKTSQALGSHKTTHKNKNKNSPTRIEKQNIVDEKLHECPYCGKFFKSAQALGGHKRSHFIIMSSSTTTTGSCSSNSAKLLHNGFIDLNMPAPMEDDEDFSQLPDFSAVSDADFQQEQGHERG